MKNKSILEEIDENAHQWIKRNQWFYNEKEINSRRNQWQRINESKEINEITIKKKSIFIVMAYVIYSCDMITKKCSNDLLYYQLSWKAFKRSFY